MWSSYTHLQHFPLPAPGTPCCHPGDSAVIASSLAVSDSRLAEGQEAGTGSCPGKPCQTPNNPGEAGGGPGQVPCGMSEALRAFLLFVANSGQLYYY